MGWNQDGEQEPMPADQAELQEGEQPQPRALLSNGSKAVLNVDEYPHIGGIAPGARIKIDLLATVDQSNPKQLEITIDGTDVTTENVADAELRRMKGASPRPSMAPVVDQSGA